jgi:hypothetical protein
VNKSLILTGIIGICALGSCKEKKVTQAYAPDRSDYIVAASQAYLLTCDSAAKITSAQVQDSAGFPIVYDQTAVQRFQLLNSLGKQGLVRAFDNQVRDLLTESLVDLHIPSADFMRVSEHVVPQNLLRNKLLVQRYLEPNRDSLRKIVLRDVNTKYTGSRARNIWLQTNTLYNQYYSTQQVEEFHFENVVNQSINLYITNAYSQEDSVKANYKNWDNKLASKAMKFAVKQ